VNWNHRLNLVMIQSVFFLAFTYQAGSKARTESKHNYFFILFSKFKFFFLFFTPEAEIFLQKVDSICTEHGYCVR